MARNKMQTKTQLNFRIEKELLKKITDQAKQEGISHTEWITKACWIMLGQDLPNEAETPVISERIVKALEDKLLDRFTTSEDFSNVVEDKVNQRLSQYERDRNYQAEELANTENIPSHEDEEIIQPEEEQSPTEAQEVISQQEEGGVESEDEREWMKLNELIKQYPELKASTLRKDTSKAKSTGKSTLTVKGYKLKFEGERKSLKYQVLETPPID